MGMCSNDLSSTNLFNSRAPALRTIPAYCGYQDLCCKRHAPGKKYARVLGWVYLGLFLLLGLAQLFYL